eukprot:m.16583 g.16583  ORF g.16583 m.16583 type:complete len:656 (-) comp8025_c0_seq1:63-2030(-)
MSNIEKKQRDALVKLAKATKTSSTKKVLSAAEKVLALLPDDPDATKCKIIALITSGKYSKAIDCIQNSPHREHFQYEHAYSLFKMQKYAKSFAIAKTLGDSLPVRELIAQLHYRLENFDKAIKGMKSLIKEEKTMERQTNVTACYAAATANDSNHSVPSAVLRRSVNSFENTYNKACIAISQLRYNDALTLINKAVDEFTALLKEEEPDISEEEIEEELSILRVQEGVVQHRIGNFSAARNLYNKAIRFAPDNTGVVAVASNNLIAINGDKDVFNSKHRMKALTVKNIEKKLSQKQLQSAAFNKCLLLLFSNDVKKCRETCAILRTKFPDSKMPDLIDAYSYLRERKVKNKAERLQSIADANPQNEVYSLVLAQEYATKGDHQRTLKSLLKAGSLVYEPSYVGYIVALCNKIGNHNVSSKHIEKAIAYYKSAPEFAGSSEITHVLLQLHGMYKLEREDFDAAVDAFRLLVDGDPEDQEANAALIVALAHVDIDAAEELSASIPPLELEGEDINVDELEEARKIRAQKTGIDIDRLTATATTTTADATDKKKKRRKRPGKKPKVMKAGGPDPERWLPKWQRGANKKKSQSRGKDNRNKKGAVIGSGTQGASDISEAEMKRLDAASRGTKTKSKSANKKAHPKKTKGKGGKGRKKRK